jgi:CubicO group peptidase (beta-lactamase class C family)
MRRLSRLATIVGCLLAISLSGLSGARAADVSGAARTLGGDYPSLRAVVVARGDCVVFEYYRPGITPATRSPVYSVTKSLLSILVGAAIDAGYLRLDQTLGEILAEATGDSVDPMARNITVRDLLTMTSGFDSAREGAGGVQAGALWRWMIERPMRYPPGTHFAYDGVSANVLSVVLARSVRQDPARFAERSLFEPLRMKDVAWPSDAEGHLIGDGGVRLAARDMAKIGFLYLRGGKWNGRQIVSEGFVRDSTTKRNGGGPPADAAYGYLWWVGPTNNARPTFFAAGQDSQLILVDPDLDLVIVISAEGLPGGSRRFVDEALLPIVASIPASGACAARLQ